MKRTVTVAWAASLRAGERIGLYNGGWHIIIRIRGSELDLLPAKPHWYLWYYLRYWKGNKWTRPRLWFLRSIRLPARHRLYFTKRESALHLTLQLGERALIIGLECR